MTDALTPPLPAALVYRGIGRTVVVVAWYSRGAFMRILKKLWYGQYSLAVTFWAFYVGGYLLVVVAGLVILSLSGGAQPVRTFNFFAQIFYLFIASVGVWISADRAQSRVGAWAARAWVLLFGLNVLNHLSRYNLPELLNSLSQR